MKYCRGFQCPNKHQCKLWIGNYKDIADNDIINKCLNSKEFIRNG